MRRVALVSLMLTVWVVLLLCAYRGLHAVTIPEPPQPTFYAPLVPNAEGDTSFVLESLTDTEAVLAWADESGVHRVRILRADFDRMFGRVKVSPLTPEEQSSAQKANQGKQPHPE